MLLKFSVENYRGFDKKIELDLTNIRDYSYNDFVIKENVINKALVYGENASGKTNLGYALFDIVTHLTEKKSQKLPYYLNANSTKKFASFSYSFKFDDQVIRYVYRKKDVDRLLDEIVYINDDKVFEYSFDHQKPLLEIRGTEQLRWNTKEDNVSSIKFIVSTLDIGDNHPITKMFNFANRMLWFMSRDLQNEFFGFTSIGQKIDSYIEENKLLKDLEEFLHNNNINEHLVIEKQNNVPILNFKFREYNIPFNHIASSGSRSLLLVFYWMKRAFDDVSFVFIDEFDAFYHHNLAMNIVDLLFKDNRFQTILTTHNSTLISNKKYRPDIYFRLDNNNINSFADLTKRGIREAHNLEKMYKAGEFEN